jgi:hypothetical protein
MSTDLASGHKPILDELEAVRLAFLRLLREIPESDWDRPLPGGGWTAKQQMVHMTQVVGILPAGIERAVKGGRRLALAFVPESLRGWVNGLILIPLLARQATPQSVAAAYEQAHVTLVRLLEGLPEEAWSKGTNYPRKYRTVEQMTHRPAEHFEQHAVQLRRILGLKPDGS